MDSYLGLSQLDSITGNHKQAYRNYKKYIVYRDSLVNEEASKKSLQAKMLYESEKNEEMAKAAEHKEEGRRRCGTQPPTYSHRCFHSHFLYRSPSSQQDKSQAPGS